MKQQQQQQAELGDKKQQAELGDKQRVLRLLQSELVPLVLQLAAQWGLSVPAPADAAESVSSIAELCDARVPPAQLLAKFLEQPAHAHSFPHVAAFVVSTFLVELQDPNADASRLADRASELTKSHLIAALDDPATTNITLEVCLQYLTIFWTPCFIFLTTLFEHYCKFTCIKYNTVYCFFSEANALLILQVDLL